MGLGDIVQKAFYLGVGLASYATEKAGDKLAELRVQSQKLVDEMVARGEVTAEEARHLVEDLVNQAQQQAVSQSQEPVQTEPRRIEIAAEPETPEEQDVEALRQQVQELQTELHKLRQK
jgi:polyhydroxyalkanoate synthesis regulator phasin